MMTVRESIPTLEEVRADLLARCTCKIYWSPIPCPVHGRFNRLPVPDLEDLPAMRKPETPAAAGDARDGLLKLAHDYAVIFAEYRRRSGWTPYSARERFKDMEDAELIAALNDAKDRIVCATPDAGGAVTIESEAVRIAREWGLRIPASKWTAYDQQAMDVIDAAIAAGQEADDDAE